MTALRYNSLALATQGCRVPNPNNTELIRKSIRVCLESDGVPTVVNCPLMLMTDSWEK